MKSNTFVQPKKISDQILDNLVRQYIRLISGGYCKRCKRSSYIEVAHMFGRRRKTVRWDLKNVYPLCSECHRDVDNDAIKKASFLYDVMTSQEIGNLQRIANMTIKDYPIDREKIRADLRNKIKELREL